jgi:hypothetical protein
VIYFLLVHETPSFRASNGPHARLVWVRIRHDSRVAKEYLLNFFGTDTMLDALWPVAIFPVEARYFHAVMIRICLHN